jgi:heat shock protein 1/8
MVFQLGERTFDVSVIALRNEIITLVATGGETNLAGENFDNTLVNLCVEEFSV